MPPLDLVGRFGSLWRLSSHFGTCEMLATPRLINDDFPCEKSSWLWDILLDKYNLLFRFFSVLFFECSGLLVWKSLCSGDYLWGSFSNVLFTNMRKDGATDFE